MLVEIRAYLAAVLVVLLACLLEKNYVLVVLLANLAFGENYVLVVLLAS